MYIQLRVIILNWTGLHLLVPGWGTILYVKAAEKPGERSDKQRNQNRL
jgi:hypothetical protein